jgi:hypothetical protein
MQLVRPAADKLAVDVQHAASPVDLHRTASWPVSTPLLPVPIGHALLVPLAAIEFGLQEC